MATSTLLRQAVRGALAVGAAGSLVGAGTALAQTQAPASSTSSQPTKLSKIIVTGSRIPRTSIATSQPVITISRQQIDATGFTTVGQILQNLSSAGASFNPQADFFIGPFSSGFEGINLYNLGSSRVLILVNGHRWIPTLDGAVDLASIPSAVVQRIEVLLDGASAIYGSDAVSGVINIITIKNFNGAKASAYLGEYDANGVGQGWDGKTQKYSVTFGSSNNKSGIVISAGYQESDPIWAGQRNISKEPLIGFGSQAYTNQTPGGSFAMGGTTFPSSLASCFTSAGCAGPLSGPDANPRQFTAADAFNYAPNHYLTIPSETWYGYAQGHYDLSDNVTYTSVFTYRHVDSTQALSPTPFGLGASGFWYANGLPIGVSGTNPYNPFGTDLIPAFSSTTAVRPAWCAQYGTGGSGTCQKNSDLLTRLSMQPFALGHRTAQYNRDTWYFRNGLNGYFQLAGNQWTWNVGYSFGRTRVTTTLGGVINTVNLQKALGPLSGCQAAPGCVPLDIFGGQSQITPAMRNYVDTILHNEAGVDQRTMSGNVAGNFWNNWYAGPWGVAVGYQWMEVNGFYQPDSLISSGNVTSNAFNPTSGRVGTNAQYVELNVPLATNLPMAKNFSIDIANRWSQFHVTGDTGSSRSHASTGRLGFKWQPIQSLLVRGTWSQSFRVPSISEFFSGQAASYNNVVDPCISSSGAPPYPNCPSSSPTKSYGQIRVTYGGNAALQPEQAITRQVGFVWSPTFLPGFNFNADYYKIEIDHAVGVIPAQQLVNGCYVGGLQNFCSQLTRRGPYLTNILDLNLNTGSLKTNGWTLGADYTFPTTPVGQFKLSFSANLVKEFTQCNVAAGAGGTLTSSCINYAGTGSGSSSYIVPKQRMNLGVDWTYGPWAATWNMTLIGRMYENCAYSTAQYFSNPPYSWCSKYISGSTANGNLVGVNELGTTVYNDIQASYTYAPWKTTFTVGVNNVFNRNPPISMTNFINNYLFYYYRIPGRFLYGRISVSF